MEKEEGDVETTPESPSIGEEPVNPEDRTDHSDSTETANTAGDDYGERAFSETGNEPVTRLVEPSVDWLEPLEEDYDEDDDDQSWDLDGSREAELDGLARDSERSHRGRGRGAVGRKRRRRQFASDEGWEDCPALGEGWKRKVVFRRSGMSVGQSDAYYMSPKGERLRSKIELLRFIRNTVDLTNFDFKLGKFVDGEIPRRGPKRKKLGHSSPADGSFSSESSFHNEAADAGDRTYSPGPLFSLNPSSSQNELSAGLPSPGPSHRDPSHTRVSPSTIPNRHTIPSEGGLLSGTSKVPASSEADPLYIPPTAVLGICVRCRNSFTGVEGQTSCEKCSNACNATKDNRNIVFRKWLPCGFCRACQVTEDCGACASCRHSKQNPDSRRPVRCRRRKCLCPSLKRRSDDVPSVTQFGSAVHRPERRLSERLVAINTISKYSDSDDQSPFDDGNGNKSLLKKSRRSCGRCKGCVSKADCGVCESCVDKPKFGGSNKKRQNCRRRQCKREARAWTTLSRPRFTYSRKKISRRSRDHWDFEFSDNEAEQERRTKESAVCHVDRGKQGSSHYNGQPNLSYEAAQSHRPSSTNPARIQTSPQADLDAVARNGFQARRDKTKSLSAIGAEPGASAPLHAERSERETQAVSRAQVWQRREAAAPSRPPAQRPAEEDEGEEDQDGPMITQIFSLGGRSGGVDLEPGLLQLLSALRGAVLPVLWCAVLAEGPRLQLLQCSKLSSMADTAVQIEPGFCYHVTVQGQPLLPTHRIYYAHPTRLTSPAQVAALLEDLERYAVCRGLERELPAGPGPVILERAATCDFLVPPEVKCCTMCKKAQQKQ
ncbi:methyl-CpG-binding domain protein 1b isoform X2 [Electrophorus electricus]|uniref:methyl-CpG-binding domain protein 1b isoform X2 n=1 Tax=Electrophorus electricus TaxID=8005 RepID=UPI0015D00FDE|nr:methyl-CpG-binding domain protein 1b isoform X2 [Electrophorus electricus]